MKYYKFYIDDKVYYRMYTWVEAENARAALADFFEGSNVDYEEIPYEEFKEFTS